MSLNSNPLQYLEDIIFYDGLRSVMDSFLGNAELLEKGYDFYPDLDSYHKFDLHENGAGLEPVVTVHTIDRNSFLEQYLNNSKWTLFTKLKEIENEIDFKDQLSNIYNHLNSCIKKHSYSESNYVDIIDKHLFELVKDLKIQFPIIEFHKVMRVLKDENGHISFFQFKDLKATFFEQLYETTYKLDLIDDIEVSEDVFYDVFTCSKPNPEQKIKFRVKNHLVAYFLKEIEPFFYNLNPVTIEKSNCFYNKQGKPLTSTDLYTSLSRNKGKDPNSIKKIHFHLDSLKKNYLK